MKKNYLDDYETIKACYENNTGFKRYVDELTLDYNLEFLNEVLDNANLKGIETLYHQNSDVAFFALMDRDAFLQSALDVDETSVAYEWLFENDDEKLWLGSYLNEYIYNSIYEQDSKEFKIVDERLNQVAYKMVDQLDKMVKSFNEPSNDEIDFTLDMLRWNSCENYYIIDNDFSQIFEDIHETRRQF